MNASFIATATTVFAMLIVICIGYAAAKGGVIDAAMSKKLSSLTVNFAQPCMLFGALSGVAYSKENLKLGLSTLGIAFIAHGILFLVALLFSKTQKDPAEKKVAEFSILFVNAAFLGFPIVEALLGDIGLFRGSFYAVTFNLLAWSLGVFIMTRGKENVKLNLRKILFNQGTIPCIVGFLFFALQIYVPSPIAMAVDYMGRLCTPLVLLVIGSNLARLPLGKMFTNARLYLTCAVRLILCPVLVSLIFHLCGMDADSVIFFAVMTALPTAALAVLFCEIYDERPQLAAQTVSMSTVLSTLTIPLAVLICTLITKIPFTIF